MDEGKQGKKDLEKFWEGLGKYQLAETLRPAPEAGAADERKGLSELGYSVVKEHRLTGLSLLKA